MSGKSLARSNARKLRGIQSFLGIFIKHSRAAERQRQQMELARAREIERRRKEEIRNRAQADKAAKQQYLEIRVEDREEKNKELAEKLSELRNILDNALNVDNTISFSNLLDHTEFSDFQLPKELQKEILAPNENAFEVQEPDFLMKLIPGWKARHEKAVQGVQHGFQMAKNNYESQVKERDEKIKQLRDEYENKKKEFEASQKQHNDGVAEFEKGYRDGEPSVIIDYCTMVLGHSSYPEDFPQKYRLAFLPESKQLVIEYQLPNKHLIPKVSEYKYIRTKDAIDEKSRKQTEIKEIYQDVVAAVCLRTIHEMFQADQGGHLDVIVFNGLVEDVDPATGQDVHPCLISIRTTKDRFKEINLSKVDKKSLLKKFRGPSITTAS